MTPQQEIIISKLKEKLETKNMAQEDCHGLTFGQCEQIKYFLMEEDKDLRITICEDLKRLQIVASKTT